MKIGTALLLPPQLLALASITTSNAWLEKLMSTV